jgi:hypothetical protein
MHIPNVIFQKNQLSPSISDNLQILVTLVVLATSAVAARAPGRFMRSPRPYAINEQTSFVSHRFGTSTYGFRTGTVGWIDNISPVFDEVCSMMIGAGNAEKKFGDRALASASSRKLPHGERLKAMLEFYNGAVVTKQECLDELEQIALFYHHTAEDGKWTYGGWSYTHEGNVKHSLSFIEA